MTETTRRGTAAPDDATEQLRVTGSRLPGPLDPASSHPPTPPATEVLSMHDLLDGPPEPALTPLPPEEAEPVAVAAPVAVAEPVAVAKPAPVAVPAAPVAVPAAPARAARPPRQRSEVAERVRSDAAAAWEGARREVSAWLGRGDNALIVGTLFVALLLLIVVAAVG